MGKAVEVSIPVLKAIAARQDRNRVPDFCGVADCGRPHRALNLCVAHYLRLYKHRKKEAMRFDYPFVDVNKFVEAYSPSDVRECSVPDCHGKFLSHGLCRKHYQRWWRLNRG